MHVGHDFRVTPVCGLPGGMPYFQVLNHQQPSRGIHGLQTTADIILHAGADLHLILHWMRQG